jgi:hypothetical protein
VGTALLVGRFRDRSPVVSVEILFRDFRQFNVSGVDSASQNEYQDIPEGKTAGAYG